MIIMKTFMVCLYFLIDCCLLFCSKIYKPAIFFVVLDDHSFSVVSLEQSVVLIPRSVPSTRDTQRRSRTYFSFRCCSREKTTNVSEETDARSLKRECDFLGRILFSLRYRLEGKIGRKEQEQQRRQHFRSSCVNGHP